MRPYGGSRGMVVIYRLLECGTKVTRSSSRGVGNPSFCAERLPVNFDGGRASASRNGLQTPLSLFN